MTTPSVGLNYLSRNRGKFVIPSLPNTSFNMREVEIPGIDLPAAIVPDPYRDKPLHGDKLEFEALTVTFLVDENLKNWLECFNWLVGLGAPRDKEEQFLTKEHADVDAYMIVYSSHNNPICKIRFIGCIPTALSGIFFSESTQETEVVEANLTLEYLRYEFVPVEE